MSRRALVLGLALGAAVLAAPGEVSAGGPLLAAHRGGAALWPENSLRAFRAALALGVDLLELDVHQTADGAVVVLHDPSLERTTTGAGEVRRATLAAVRALRLRDRAGHETEDGVPTLGEVLDLLAPTPAGLLLEIKNAPARGRYAGIEEAVLREVANRGLGTRTVVMSFDAAILRRVRELDGALRTSLLVSSRGVERAGASPLDALAWATEAGATDVGFLHTLLTPEVVAAARARGLRVAAWTVNDAVSMRRVIELGADVLITDRPDLAKEILGR